MKTYLLDSINRLKRYSESLDATTIICNKTWIVFNDSGIKETYIFQEDGDLIISNNGVVTDGKWKYITSNRSLIISGNNQKYMLHPEFFDGVVFALQLDGTKEYSFMIDEANVDAFAPKTRNELLDYFDNRIRIEEKKEKAEQKLIRLEQKRKEEERIIEHDRLENNLGYLIYNICGHHDNVSFLSALLVISIAVGGTILIFILEKNDLFHDWPLTNIETTNTILTYTLGIIIFCVFGYIIFVLFAFIADFFYYPISYWNKKRKINKWIKQNPSSPRVNVLKQYNFKYHFENTKSLGIAACSMKFT